MKIPLHAMHGDSRAALHRETRFTEGEIQACKRGDWEAKHRMATLFMPLIVSLAKKRAADGDVAKLNLLTEAGKKGLFAAARKYKPAIGADKFQVFALDFIEAAMDRAASGGSWLSRLFGRG